MTTMLHELDNDGILILTLHRPEKLNALNDILLTEWIKKVLLLCNRNHEKIYI